MNSYDQILPYVFCGELSAWVVDAAIRQCSHDVVLSDTDAWDCCVKLLFRLDKVFAVAEDNKNRAITDLIGAGFAECVWTFCLSKRDEVVVEAENAFELIISIGSGALSHEIQKWRNV